MCLVAPLVALSFDVYSGPLPNDLRHWALSRLELDVCSGVLVVATPVGTAAPGDKDCPESKGV